MNLGQANYLRLTLEAEGEARNSTSAEARKRHEELAIAYEMRCLLGIAPKASPGVKKAETAA